MEGKDVRKKHPNKEIEAVIEYAEMQGWQVIECSGHAWGMLRCPHNNKECRCGQFCQMSVWSTPMNCGNHARQLKKRIDGCLYQDSECHE